MYSLILPVFVISILLSIPYLIWVIVTIIKKKWKKLTYMIAIPTAFYGCVFLAQVWLNNISHNNYLEGIYGGKTVLSDPIFTNDSERSFNGDGASIYVYDLPDEVKHRFIKPSEDFLSQYPIKPSYRSHWEAQTWRQAPYTESDQKYIDFGLWAAASQEGSLKNALNRTSTYYAYFHYDHGDNPGNIDLYVIDLLENKIYFVNLNT